MKALSRINALAVVCIAVTLFAVFPLTDTDIWWHLACAREWVTTWTPVRVPVVNVHDFFQRVVGAVYGVGGAPLLVAFKALLWGLVFALFLWPVRKKVSLKKTALAIILLFFFRYQFEIRPVVFTLIFLGVFWNVLPFIFNGEQKDLKRKVVAAIFILTIQWFWCKFQGLYILGGAFAVAALASFWKDLKIPRHVAVMFIVALIGMPFLHSEGIRLFLYPFGLLDRLLGLTESAAVFASQIAENRSPVTLMMVGENRAASAAMLLLATFAGTFSAVSLVHGIRTGSGNCCKTPMPQNFLTALVLFVTAILVLVAERNFVLFLPVFLYALLAGNFLAHNVELAFSVAIRRIVPASVYIIVVAFVIGIWCRSLTAYDSSMVSYQRVPVAASSWMKSHPHEGRLFNDDRAGGYLAFMNPQDSTFIDGRFILKTADFFEQYLHFAEIPEDFFQYAEQTGIDRAIFPLQYYARWQKLLQGISRHPAWRPVYKDDFFIVLDKI